MRDLWTLGQSAHSVGNEWISQFKPITLSHYVQLKGLENHT